MISYKEAPVQEICRLNIDISLDNIVDKCLNEDQIYLLNICYQNSIPTPNELKALYDYCNTSCSDDLGINLYLFSIVFNSNIIYSSNKLLLSTLMETCQIPSFNANQFLNSECINCLTNHILNCSQVAKYAICFLINLLYKTKKRKFLQNTIFFSLFETNNNNQDLENIIFAFLSDPDEIDQEIFNMLNFDISKHTFSSNDIHKTYRYLVTILALAKNNIKFEMIDSLIDKNIEYNEIFIIEINLYLIQYSQNPKKYYNYMLSNLIDKFNIDSIAKASIRAFNSCWFAFDTEQKKRVSNFISSSIPNMSYSLRFECVLFICNVKDWNIFNDIIFFEEVFYLITEKEISYICIEAIYSFLLSDISNVKLYIQVINLLNSFIEDLTQIAYSAEEPQNKIAQALVDIVDNIIENNISVK